MGEADYRTKVLARSQVDAVASAAGIAALSKDSSAGGVAIDFAVKLQQMNMSELASDHWPSHAAVVMVQAEIGKQVDYSFHILFRSVSRCRLALLLR